MLTFALIWALLTINLYFPWRGKPELMGVVSFMFGMLIGELPLHFIALEFLTTLLIITSSGLNGLGDALGLLIAVGSWLGMANFFLRAHNAKKEMSQGIRQALGDDYDHIFPVETRALLAEPIDYRKLVNPFAYKQPGVKRHRNIAYYDNHDATLRLDVFHHEDMPKNAPVLFQVHGGAWLEHLGNKDQQALPLMAQLAQHGWVCVTVQYRLSPSATFPTHIIDCKRALAWVKENIEQYGGDPDFIVATGGSAGGHLSGLLALSANDPDYQPGFEDVDTSVQGCVPFYGIFDFTNSREQRRHPGLDQLLTERVLKASRYENPELWEKSSPLFRASPEAPPTLIIHGEADTLAPVTESRELFTELQKYPEVKVGMAELSDAQHAFDLMYSLRCLHVINGVESFATALHQRYLQASRIPEEAAEA